MHAVATLYGDGPGTEGLSNPPSGSEWLDLAPYRFNATSTLIGVRSDHTTGDGDYAQVLNLFLLRGSNLEHVATFRTLAWHARLTSDTGARQTFSDVFEESRIIVAPRGGGGPNDLISRTRFLECKGEPGESIYRHAFANPARSSPGIGRPNDTATRPADATSASAEREALRID